MTSPQSNALREHFITLYNQYEENPAMSLDAMREMFDSLHHLQSEPADVTCGEVVVGDRPAMWVRPIDAHEDRVVLYAHGDGSSPTT